MSPWLDHPERAGVFTDFDGTLAPIVDSPDQAAPLPGAREVLARLAARYATVAVISGRPVDYLRAHLPGVAGLVLIGLYGLERADGLEVRELPDATRWRDPVEAVAQRAENSAPPGVLVERKGLTVTLHVRGAPWHAGWVERFAAAQAATTGLVAHSGKKSVELRPPVKTDKGSALAQLARGLDAVCFVGDDLGDLAAFERLHELRATGISTLAVAVAGPEAPARLLAAADVEVDGPAGALAMLSALAG